MLKEVDDKITQENYNRGQFQMLQADGNHLQENSR